MTIAEKALEADLLYAIKLRAYSSITAAHERGADLIAGVVQSAGKAFS
jgi:hypothetical protein